MPPITLENLYQWVLNNEVLLWWMAAASVVIFFGTLAAIPWLVVRIPTNYFARSDDHPPFFGKQHPVIHSLLVTLFNILGVCFVLAGILMLVLPGQGLLTILIGLLLMHFPGKYRIVRRAITTPSVFNTINRIRRRAGREPLKLGPPEDSSR